MTFIGPTQSDLSYLKKLTRLRVLRDNTTQKADPRLASTISTLSAHYKDMTPGVVYALAKQGIGPGDLADKIYQQDVRANLARKPGTIQNALAKGNLKDVTLKQIKSITDDEAKALSPKQKLALLERAKSQVGSGFGGGILNPIGNAFDEAGGAVQRNVLDPVERNVVEPAFGKVQDVTRPGMEKFVEPTTRTIGNVAQAGYEGLQGALRARESLPLVFRVGSDPTAVVRAIFSDDPEKQVKGDTNRALEQLTHIPQQTTLYQQLSGKDVGGGFFTSPESPAGQAQAAAARKYSPYLIGGHAWTPGRAIANTVWEPDDDAFKIASGLVDAGVAMKADPANLLLDISSAARASHGMWEADAVLDAKATAGALSGYRYGFSPRRFSEVIQTKGMRNTLAAMREETNPRAIVENFNMPMYLPDGTPIADQIARASTDEEILSVLKPHVGGAGITEIPKYKPPVITSRFGEDTLTGKVARSLNRLREDVPSKFVYAGENADLDVAWKELDRSLVNVKASDEARDRVAQAWAAIGREEPAPLGGWAWSTVNQSKLDRQEAAMGVFFDTIGEQVKAHGLPEDLVDHAREAFQKEWGGKVPLDVDANMEPIIQDRVVLIGGDGKPLPHPIDEESLFGWTVELPDARALRTELSHLKPLLTHPLVLGTQDGIDLMMRVWRSAVLSRPATALRVVGEEQMRIAVMGYNSGFRHPLSWIAYAMGNPDERWVERLHSNKFTKGAGDVLERFRDAHGMRPYLLGEFNADSDFFRNTMYETRFGAITNQRSTKLRLSGFQNVDRNSEHAALAIADEITRMRSSGVYREVSLNGTDSAAYELERGSLSHLPLRNADTGEITARGLPHPDPIPFDEPANIPKRPDYTKAPEGSTIYDPFATNVEPVRKTRMEPILDSNGAPTGEYRTINFKVRGRPRPGTEPVSAPTGAEWGSGEMGGVQVADRSIASRGQAEAVSDAIKTVTGNHPELVDAIKTGRINGHQIMRYNNTPNKAALNEIQRIINEDNLKQITERVLPNEFRIDNWHLLPKQIQENNIKRLDTAMNAIMENVLTRPSNFFSRNPMLQQTFLEELKRSFPYMDHEARLRVLEHVDEANLSKTARNEFDYMHRRLTRIEEHNAGFQRFPTKAQMEEKKAAGLMPVEHQLSYESATMLAKKRAMDKTKNLLYDLSRRSQFFDMTRTIFPFGEAFKEVATRWMKLTYENPRVFRRVQQGLTAARSEGSSIINKVQGIPQPLDKAGNPTGGFFYKDQYGQESFAFPGSAALTQAVFGAPIPLKGSVQGLNIVGTGLPGVGPIVQLPMAYLIPDKPEWDWFRSKVFPFGDPKGQGFIGKAAQSLVPGWAQKIEGAIFGNPDFDRTYASSVIDMARYLESTGDYKLIGPNAQSEVTRLLDDAKRNAKQLAIIRGIGQSSLPTSPSPEWLVHDKNGKLTMQFALADWYRRQLELPGMDYQKVGEAFLNRFGKDNFLVTQGKSKALIPGSVTSATFDWERNNPDMKGKFPHVYALFAPISEDNKLDQRAYEAQFDKGERQALTPEQAIRLANGRLATMVYSKLHDSLGPKIDANEEYALRKLRQTLTMEFPGYGEKPIDFTRSEILINELTRAKNDPTLRKTDAGKALRIYLGFRDTAQKAVERQGGASFTTSQATAGIRHNLNAIGEELIRRYPSFQPMWDSVFKLEVD